MVPILGGEQPKSTPCARHSEVFSKTVPKIFYCDLSPFLSQVDYIEKWPHTNTHSLADTTDLDRRSAAAKKKSKSRNEHQAEMIVIIKDAGCWMLASARRMEKNGAGGEFSAALEALVKPTDNRKNELFFLFFLARSALLCFWFTKDPRTEDEASGAVQVSPHVSEHPSSTNSSGSFGSRSAPHIS